MQWTLSAVQHHPWALIIADADATLELRVKTVRYFRSIERVQEEVEQHHAELRARGVGTGIGGSLGVAGLLGHGSHAAHGGLDDV